MRICIVSPHRDDACLSLGMSLIRWARAGHRIRIVNCFTRSASAPYSDADTVHANDRTSYVSAVREKEDKVFLRRVPGAEMVDLRLKDAPLRMRCKEHEVHGRPVNEADPAIAKIATALEKRVGSNQVDLLLLPFGIGRHVDHSTAREAALPFARELACGFYDDMPYPSLVDADLEVNELREEIATHTAWQIVPLLCRAGITAASMKRELARIYCSQIDEATVDAIAEIAGRDNGERIWANDRLLALVEAGISGWSDGFVI